MEDIQMEDIDRYRELNGENKSGYYLRTCIKNGLHFFNSIISTQFETRGVGVMK